MSCAIAGGRPFDIFRLQGIVNVFGARFQFCFLRFYIAQFGVQRSSALHSELRDVEAKKAELEARAEDIDYALKPENIERSTAGYGTTHPEELREQRRKQLENEKQRVLK